jgi:hypothetical protein
MSASCHSSDCVTSGQCTCINVEAHNSCARCYGTVASGHDSPDMQLQRELLRASRYICRAHIHVALKLSARNRDTLVSVRRNSESARCVNNDSRHKTMQGLDPVRSCRIHGTVHLLGWSSRAMWAWAKRQLGRVQSQNGRLAAKAVILGCGFGGKQAASRADTGCHDLGPWCDDARLHNRAVEMCCEAETCDAYRHGQHSSER